MSTPYRSSLHTESQKVQGRPKNSGRSLTPTSLSPPHSHWNLDETTPRGGEKVLPRELEAKLELSPPGPPFSQSAARSASSYDRMT